MLLARTHNETIRDSDMTLVVCNPFRKEAERGESLAFDDGTSSRGKRSNLSIMAGYGG